KSVHESSDFEAREQDEREEAGESLAPRANLATHGGTLQRFQLLAAAKRPRRRKNGCSIHRYVSEATKTDAASDTTKTTSRLASSPPSAFRVAATTGTLSK